MHEQKPLDEKQLLTATADAILQEPVMLTVATPPANRWQRLLNSLHLRSDQRSFTIRPLYNGSVLRVSRLLLSMDKSLLTREALENKDKFLNTAYELMGKHAEDLARIVAIAVTNEEKVPAQKLVDFFLFHMTPKDMLQVIQVVVSQMNPSDFIASIISVRGLSVLEEKAAPVSSAGMNPVSQGSPIASGV